VKEIMDRYDKFSDSRQVMENDLDDRKERLDTSIKSLEEYL